MLNNENVDTSRELLKNKDSNDEIFFSKSIFYTNLQLKVHGFDNRLIHLGVELFCKQNGSWEILLLEQASNAIPEKKQNKLSFIL